MTGGTVPPGQQGMGGLAERIASSLFGAGAADISAVDARVRAREAAEFQRRLLPPREELVWGGQQPLVPPLAMSEPPADSGVSGIHAADLALLSTDVHRADPLPPAGCRVAGPADLDRLGLDPHHLASPVSGLRARAYVAEATGETVIAFRSGARQGATLPSDHYARALQIGQAVGRSGETRVTFAGRGQDGEMAAAAAHASGLEAARVASPADQAMRVPAEGTMRRLAEIAGFGMSGEVLSAMQDGGDRAIGALFAGR